MKEDESHASPAGLEGGDYDSMVSLKPRGMSFPQEGVFGYKKKGRKEYYASQWISQSTTEVDFTNLILF